MRGPNAPGATSWQAEGSISFGGLFLNKVIGVFEPWLVEEAGQLWARMLLTAGQPRSKSPAYPCANGPAPRLLS